MPNTTSEQQIKIAKDFVAIHTAPFDQWTVSLTQSQLSEDERYLRIYPSILAGVFGECNPLDAEYDEQGNLVKEATLFEVEISKFESKCGLTSTFIFEHNPAINNNLKYMLLVHSGLKKFGTTEDGEDYIGEIYYVIAEDKNGNRWVSPETFPGCVVRDDDSDLEGYGIGYYFDDTRAEAQIDAYALIEKMKANSDNIDIATAWRKTESAYGSPSHDEGALIEFEREMEERPSMGGW